MEFAQLKCHRLSFLLFATIIGSIWMQVESSRQEYTPLMTLTYATNFNREDERGHQSQTCGRYYGITFMQRFYTQTSNLQDLCNENVAPNRHVNVTMVAKGRVRFPETDVQLITYLNVTVDGLDSRKEDILACALLLNGTTLTDSGNILTIPAKDNCPAVTMQPPYSVVTSAEWACQGERTLDTTTWECKDANASALRCPRWLDELDDSSLRMYRGKCYQFVASQRYWGQARDYCWRYEGRLVKIADSQINDWLINAISHDLQWDKNGVWIGLNDRTTENTFVWVTDSVSGSEVLDWSNWADGHPSSTFNRARDCVRMNRHSGKWLDTACSAIFWKYRFICEYDLHAGI